MELTGEHRIPASRDVVWKALHDADILKDCIKGCEKFEFVDDNEIVARVKAKVGPVSATFDADVFIENQVEPEGYTLRGEGKGGVAGFAKGSADVKLAEDGPDTILTYHAKATVGGKLAQLGSRLVDTTAKKYAADFFEKLTQKLTSDAAPRPAEGVDVVTSPAPETAPLQPAPGEVVSGKQAVEGSATEPKHHEGDDAKSAALWIGIAVAIAVAAAALWALS